MIVKQFYNITIKVKSKKSATSFGDLPDYLFYVDRPLLSCHFVACVWADFKSTKLFQDQIQAFKLNSVL